MKAGFRQAVRAAGAILVVLCAATVVVAQTQPVQYGYDELGRLTVVADQTGAIAIYNYDILGNLLSIQRIDAPQIIDPVAITYFTPAQGKGMSRPLLNLRTE